MITARILNCLLGIGCRPTVRRAHKKKRVPYSLGFSSRASLSASCSLSTQKQKVWATAKTSSGQLLQRHEFYVAMRVVSLAQSGETTLNRKRLKETATNELPMAQLKGAPKPSIENSKGRKLPPQPPPKPATAVKDLAASKINAKGVKMTEGGTSTGKGKQGPKGVKKTYNDNNCGSPSKDREESPGSRKEGKHRVTTTTGETNVPTTTKPGKTSDPKQRARFESGCSMATSSDDTKSDDGSDSGSEAHSESDGDESDGDAASEGRRNGKIAGGSKNPASDDNGNASDGGSESSHSSSSSSRGKSGGKHNGENGSYVDSNAGSSSGSDSASDDDSRGSEDGDGEPAPESSSVEKGLKSSGTSSSNSDSNSGSHSDDCGPETASCSSGTEGDDPFRMTEKARIRYHVSDSYGLSFRLTSSLS